MFWRVQTMPSDETEAAESWPCRVPATATKTPFPKAIDINGPLVPEDRGTQSLPLVEVRMVPPPPVTTNKPFPYTIAQSGLLVPDVWAVQSFRLVDVIMTPSPGLEPIAT